MGGHKKSKAGASAQKDSGNDERQQGHDVADYDDAQHHDGAAVQPTDASDAASDAGSSNSEVHKKKKVYKGNRLNKQSGGKKGKHTAPPETTASATRDGSSPAGAAAGDDHGGEEDEEPLEVTRQKPVAVLYCPICTFPAEMCEFSGMMEKCRPWLQEHAAELADAEERGRRRRILTEKDRLDALVDGRGIKKALQRVVVLEVEKRTGRHMLTTVTGMDLFGHNLKDVSRDWRKSFACGVGVREPEEGKHQNFVEIQGNVMDQLAQLLLTKYKIPKDAVYMMEGKKKVSYDFS